MAHGSSSSTKQKHLCPSLLLLQFSSSSSLIKNLFFCSWFPPSQVLGWQSIRPRLVSVIIHMEICILVSFDCFMVHVVDCDCFFFFWNYCKGLSFELVFIAKILSLIMFCRCKQQMLSEVTRVQSPKYVSFQSISLTTSTDTHVYTYVLNLFLSICSGERNTGQENQEASGE